MNGKLVMSEVYQYVFLLLSAKQYGNKYQTFFFSFE